MKNTQKDFDGWNKRKKSLNKEVFNSYVHSKEIWWCAIGVNVGDEEDGKNTLFERPVLVMKKFNQIIDQNLFDNIRQAIIKRII